MTHCRDGSQGCFDRCAVQKHLCPGRHIWASQYADGAITAAAAADDDDRDDDDM